MASKEKIENKNYGIPSHLFGDLILLAGTVYNNYCFKIKFTTQVIKIT